MKTRITITCIGILFLAASWKVASNILEKLGLQEKTAKAYILQNLIGDFNNGPIGEAEEDFGGTENSTDQQLKSFKIPHTNMLASIMAGDKSAITKELCQYIKEYVSSNDFAGAYAKKREEAKPTSEPYRMDATALASLKANLKEAEANLIKMKNAKFPAATTQQMESAISSLKKNIAAQNDPTPNKTKWNKMYPANAADMVKAKLQEYISLVSTVDFNAATTTVGRRQKFVNPAYEKKSLKWKAIYRAGKDVNNIASSFCKEWLNEGIKLNSFSKPETTTENIASPTKAAEESKNQTPSIKKGILNKIKSATKIPY